MKTLSRKPFGRYSSKQGQMPLATGRLEHAMAGENKEALCH
jgi:hypothetical protein